MLPLVLLSGSLAYSNPLTTIRWKHQRGGPLFIVPKIILFLKFLKPVQKHWHLLSQLTELYNSMFSMNEFLAAWDQCHNTSSGQDGICNQMLFHSAPKRTECILCTQMYMVRELNSNCMEGSFWLWQSWKLLNIGLSVSLLSFSQLLSRCVTCWIVSVLESRNFYETGCRVWPVMYAAVCLACGTCYLP
jgi:hypothetical protein